MAITEVPQEEMEQSMDKKIELNYDHEKNAKIADFISQMEGTQYLRKFSVDVHQYWHST